MSKHLFQIPVSFLAAFFFAIASIQSAYAKNDLTPYQKAAIATRFASEVKYNFAGYGKFLGSRRFCHAFQKCKSWQSGWNSYRRKHRQSYPH